MLLLFASPVKSKRKAIQLKLKKRGGVSQIPIDSTSDRKKPFLGGQTGENSTVELA